MNRKVIWLLAILVIVLIAFFMKDKIFKNTDSTINYSNEDLMNKSNIEKDGIKIMDVIKIKVNNEILNVKLENNSSSAALVEKLKQSDIIIEAHDYGNFEKVGDLGFNLPTNDKRITTKPGDLILYQGNNITLYYDTNTWTFTKLGEVIGVEKEKLKDILGEDNVRLVLTIN